MAAIFYRISALRN